VAQNLGIPLGVEEAVDTAVHGVPLGIDLGRLADGRYYRPCGGCRMGRGGDAGCHDSVSVRLNLHAAERGDESFFPSSPWLATRLELGERTPRPFPVTRKDVETLPNLRYLFGMEAEYLIVRGAREHYLQNIDVQIPRDRLTVITGLSGSGKSSLAFDTIYADGQRRYVESFSAYARQFLGTRLE
jgi:hypothetical protein